LADALVLANLAKASILVVEPGSTRARDLEAAVKRMHQGRAHILGAALAKVGRSGTGYGYGYDYQYNYLYNYGRNGREAALPELDRA
jgi:tyrosine-protein kinase Etk/Wzc